MNEMNPILQALIGVGVSLLVILLSGVAIYLALAVKQLKSKFASIDAALVPFGQSGVGKLVNNAVETGRTYVDQATDPAIIQIATFLGSVAVIVKAANAAGIKLTPERVAMWGRALFDTLDTLTDGVPPQEDTAFNRAMNRAAGHVEKDFFTPPQQEVNTGGAVR